MAFSMRRINLKKDVQQMDNHSHALACLSRATKTGSSFVQIDQNVYTVKFELYDSVGKERKMII